MNSSQLAEIKHRLDNCISTATNQAYAIYNLLEANQAKLSDVDVGFSIDLDVTQTISFELISPERRLGIIADAIPRDSSWFLIKNCHNKDSCSGWLTSIDLQTLLLQFLYLY